LRAGMGYFIAVYSGDDIFAPDRVDDTEFTVSAPTGPANQAPNPSSCPCAGPVAKSAGDGQASTGGQSEAGVNYGTGTVGVVRSDLSSDGFGTAFGQTWDWTNAGGYADGTSGNGATATQAPHLVQANGDDSIAAVANSSTAYFFDLYGGAYHERYGGTATLV